MSDIFDIKDMTEEDIKLQYITPALLAKWDIKKITMETSPLNKFTDGKVRIKGNIPSRDKGDQRKGRKIFVEMKLKTVNIT